MTYRIIYAHIEKNYCIESLNWDFNAFIIEKMLMHDF